MCDLDTERLTLLRGLAADTKYVSSNLNILGKDHQPAEQSQLLFKTSLTAWISCANSLPTIRPGIDFTQAGVLAVTSSHEESFRPVQRNLSKLPCHARFNTPLRVLILPELSAEMHMSLTVNAYGTSGNYASP